MRTNVIVGLFNFMFFIATVQSCMPSIISSDPIVGLNSSQIIEFYGYTSETHTVTTKDGYMIDIFRIPYGKNGPSTAGGQPVLIQHGLVCDSNTWLWNIFGMSLPLLLADAGYDVWIGNFRGNDYGLRHVNLSSSNQKFWDFSWDEMAKYDLPAVIDKILEQSDKKSIVHIGHSMGTTTMFALLSTQPEYNEKVGLFVALAPVAFVANFPPAFQVLSQITSPLFTLLGPLTRVKINLNSAALAAACKITVVETLLCSNIIVALFGSDPQQYNRSRADVYLSIYPASTSLKTIQHYLQEIKAGGNFTAYDYGAAGNQKKYNQSTPPYYDITKITTPIAMMWSQNDNLATPENVAKLPNYIKNLAWNYRIDWDDFTHFEFQAANEINSLLHEPLMAKMKELGF